MTAVIRVDSSDRIGSGHLMRCITLADKLSNDGISVLFVCRAHNRNLSDFARERGYKVVELNNVEDAAWEFNNADPVHASWLGTDWLTDARDTKQVIEDTVEMADWLIVDHYGVERRWESTMRDCARRLMVIDDLADRQHDCDLLVDQTYGRLPGEYEQLVPAHCRKLVGSDYALLRPEFRHWRKASLRRSRPFQRERLRVLLNLGGTDGGDLTTQVLRASDSYSRAAALSITVIMGAGAPHLNTVRDISKRLSGCVEVRVGVTNMAELMAQADVAIGAAGATSWERCCLGLPTVMLVIANNQQAIAAKLAAAGAAVIVDPSENFHGLNAILDQAMDDSTFLKAMSERAAALVDGEGTNRVVKAMSLYSRPIFECKNGNTVLNNRLNSDVRHESNPDSVQVRPMVWGDVETVFQWQSKAEARKHSRNPESPTWTEHLSWWEARWSQNEVVNRIVESQGSPVGFLRLDPVKESGEWEVSILIDPAIKGRGYGKAALLHLCREFGDRDLVAEVAEANYASQRLFEAVGFKRVSPTKFRLRACRARP